MRLFSYPNLSVLSLILARYYVCFYLQHSVLYSISFRSKANWCFNRTNETKLPRIVDKFVFDIIWRPVHKRTCPNVLWVNRVQVCHVSFLDPITTSLPFVSFPCLAIRLIKVSKPKSTVQRRFLHEDVKVIQ